MTKETTKTRINKKAMDFVRAKAKGLSAKEAAIAVGFSPRSNTTKLESSKAIQEASRTFKEAIARRATKDEVIGEMFKNALQNEDKGAKNTALKMIADRYEPETAVPETENKILMVFNQPKD